MINRYKYTDKIIVEGKTTVGPYVEPPFVSDPTNEGTIKIPASRSGRPDLIANDLYGDPSLFWVLMIYNNVTKVMNWPKNGEVIKYPPINRVMRDSF